MAGRKACICVVGVLVVGLITGVVLYIHHRRKESCPDGSFGKAAVAADSDTCSGVGRDILLSGGSAADGAIAALLCTSVINPQSNGIGGGAIFTIRDRNGTVKTINARETVPKDFKEDLSDCSFDTTGPRWIGVPSEIRGYEYVHRLYGRLPWSKLFQPTIRLARDGVKISKTLAGFLPQVEKHSTRQLFVDAKGNMLKEGDTVKFEKLAKTLEKIAARGADEFYTGDTAKDLISDIQEAGGALTLGDLSSVEVTDVDSWNVSLSNYTMYFPPPPSRGALVSFILNVMEGYNPSPASLEGRERVLTYHRYIEASKFAAGLKSRIKDPRFNPTEVLQKAVRITQKEFANDIRKNITDNGTHDDEYYKITQMLDTPGTTHVSVLDEHGLAVSATSTINYLFGSGVLSSKTGILLNNMMTDFCGTTGRVHPGERPPSYSAPTILHSKTTNHTVIIGGAGGSKIPTGITMALMNFLWFGKSLKDSIAAPLVSTTKQDFLFEPGFDKEVISGLKVLGHKVPVSQNMVNALSKRNKCIEAVSDARKMGKPAGY